MKRKHDLKFHDGSFVLVEFCEENRSDVRNVRVLIVSKQTACAFLEIYIINNMGENATA